MSTNFCKVCGGKIGFTSSESRRHEATKRHTDAVADLAFAKMDAPRVAKGRKIVVKGLGEILNGTATAESVLSEISETIPEIDLGPVVDESGAPTDQTLAVLTDAAPVEESPVLVAEKHLASGGTVAELKAIRMRAKWAAERAERRSLKDPKNKDLLKASEAAWKAERVAYKVYREALLAAKDAKEIAAL